MAAPILPYRIQAGKLRKLALDITIATLNGEGEYGEDLEFKKQLLLRIASNILPRLNEHSGEGGGSIKINVVNYGDNPSSVLSETISNTITEIDG